MQKNRWLKLIAPALALGAALTACSDGSSTGADRGVLRVELTDAPFHESYPVAKAEIYVVRIDAKRDSTTEQEADEAQSKNTETRVGDQQGNGWVTIATPNRRINVFDLQNGKTVNLGELSLPTGTYKGFRLVINTDSSSVTLKDGSTVDVKWPSAGRSGIKVKLEQPINVTAGQTLMVIDFDLGKSFHPRGPNGLTFRPVIRAVAKDIAGMLQGLVTSDSAKAAPVAGAAVEVLVAGTAAADTAAANVVATTSTGADGKYAFFLRPADYAVRVKPPAGSTNQPAYTAKVTVTTGQQVSADMVLLPAVK